MPFAMCDKHDRMYRLGEGCPICKQEKHEFQELKRIKSLKKPAIKLHVEEPIPKVEERVPKKRSGKMSFAKYCKSLGVKTFKEDLSEGEKGDGVIELKEEDYKA